MMKFGSSLVLLLIIAGITYSQQYEIGYVNSDGYTYSGNNIWTYNGGSYTRTAYFTQSPGYWRCGVYYPGAYTTNYQYAHYIAPKESTYQTPPTYEQGWKSKLLDMAAARDKIEGEIRKGAYDHAAYLDAIKALGFQGNFRWEGYGTIPPYGIPQQGQNRAMPYAFNQPYSYELTNFGATANTQYGYSYNTIAQLYGDTNLNALYQQAGQLVQGAQKLSGDANTGFQGLVGQEGVNRAKVAEILAKGQMAHQILQALNTPGESKGYTFKFSTGGKVERIEEGLTPDTKVANFQKFTEVSTKKCASCHSGKVLKGNFDIASYPGLSQEDKKKIWGLLTTDDDKSRMPRNADGTAGRLTPEEFKAFLVN